MNDCLGPSRQIRTQFTEQSPSHEFYERLIDCCWRPSDQREKNPTTTEKGPKNANMIGGVHLTGRSISPTDWLGPRQHVYCSETSYSPTLFVVVAAVALQRNIEKITKFRGGGGVVFLLKSTADVLQRATRKNRPAILDGPWLEMDGDPRESVPNRSLSVSPPFGCRLMDGRVKGKSNSDRVATRLLCYAARLQQLEEQEEEWTSRPRVPLHKCPATVGKSKKK